MASSTPTTPDAAPAGTAAATGTSASIDRAAIEAKVDLPILYVDEHIVVVNKPSGLNTIPGNELVKEEAEAPPQSAAEAEVGATEAAAAAASDTPAAPNHDTDGDQAARAAASTTPTGNDTDTNTTKKKRTHQELWHDMLRGPELQAEAAALPPDRRHLRPYLESIGARSREAVPRKRQRFLPWGQRTLKCDARTVDELFEVLRARFEATEGGRTDSVLTRLLRHFKEVKTVHRLDCETSGACVLGLSAAAARELSAQFKAKVVEKRYVAVIEHGPSPLPLARGRIDLAVRPEYAIRPKQLVDPVGGKEARTLFRVVAVDRAAGRSRVALTPLTGRTHQLRLHMAAMGAPIVGDSIYSAGDRWVGVGGDGGEDGGDGAGAGAAGVPSFVRPLDDEDEVERAEDGGGGTDGASAEAPEERPLSVVEGRLHLHAEVLSINHPATGERTTFVAEAPF